MLKDDLPAAPREAVALPDPLSPDISQVDEDRLKAEAVELERLVRFNLSESAAGLRDGDLARGRPFRKDRRSQLGGREHAACLHDVRIDCCRPRRPGLADRVTVCPDSTGQVAASKR